jgi:hypothetical protein
VFCSCAALCSMVQHMSTKSKQGVFFGKPKNRALALKG